MNMKRSGISIAIAVVSAALGWYAAMEVSRGPALESEQDAYERFSNAFTIPDSLERIEAVDRLVRRLTPETLPGAVRALKEDQKDVYNYDLKMLLYYWAKEDPRGMLAEIQTWPEVRSQRIAAGEAIYWVLKKEGFDAARALFDELPHHQRIQAVVQLVLASLESGQTQDLAGLINSHQADEERALVAGIVAGRILQVSGPEALVSWVESIPVGFDTASDLKVVAFEAAQSELMRRDQFEFLETWFDRLEGQQWARRGGRKSVAIHLAKRDPMRAIAYAESLPPEKGRDQVLSLALRSFAQHDRQGALAFLRSRDPDPSLDEGAARLVYEFALRNPEVALEMLGRIRNPNVFARSEKTARFHFQSLPEETKKTVLARLDAIPKPVAVEGGMEPAVDPDMAVESAAVDLPVKPKTIPKKKSKP